MEQTVLAGASEMDFSLISLFWQATPVVKIVMIMLVAASFWSWAIIIQKLFNYARAKREGNVFEEAFWSGQPLDQIYDRVGQMPRSAVEKIFAAGMGEWRRSHLSDGHLMTNAQARIDRAMNVAIGRESDALMGGLTFLATVGSISPFVGLFGTVWGIKHAFEQIAHQQSTNLAVVAPGIAPAVIFYNKLSGDAEKIVAEHETFADEFSMILSRQLDREG